MPWQLEAMKDVLTCDKLSQASKKHLRLRFPNGETHLFIGIVNWIHRLTRRTRRTETSKYPQEQKSTEISKVAASEIETALKLYCS